MNRQDIRKQALAIRSQMGSGELERLGGLIAGHVLGAGWYLEARCVHCFFGVIEKGEIPTERILSDAVSSGKVLALPKVTDSEGGMKHVRVHDPAHLVPGPWGIPVPAGREEVAVADIDLILVPGLAADREGNRIGYGKGYYDRFLVSAARAVKVMLVPERLVHNRLPAEDHDVPVDFLATENGILSCKT